MKMKNGQYEKAQQMQCCQKMRSNCGFDSRARHTEKGIWREKGMGWETARWVLQDGQDEKNNWHRKASIRRSDWKRNSQKGLQKSRKRKRKQKTLASKRKKKRTKGSERNWMTRSRRQKEKKEKRKKKVKKEAQK